MMTVSTNDLIGALKRARAQIYNSYSLPSDAKQAVKWLDEILAAVGE